MAEEANLQELKSELERLRSEFGQLKTDMQNERVTRAEQHMGYMRNWLGIYTGTVTLIFVGFALLGFRSYSDIQTSRDRVDAEATKVQRTAQDFYVKLGEANQKLDSFSAKEKRFEEVAAQNETVVGGIKGSVNMLQSSLTGLNGQYQEIQRQSNGLETRLKVTSALAAQTNLDTTGLRGQFRAFGLGQPTLFLSGLFTVGKNIITTIDGANLGSTQGHLYVRAQLLGLDELSPPPPIEIGKESIREWTDSAVKFVLSPTAESALREAKSKLEARPQPPTVPILGSVGGLQLSTVLTLGPVLAFQVQTADGTVSLWTHSNLWPMPEDK